MYLSKLNPENPFKVALRTHTKIFLQREICDVTLGTPQIETNIKLVSLWIDLASNLMLRST